MAEIKELLLECNALRIENKTLLKKISLLQKQVEELMLQDTSLKY